MAKPVDTDRAERIKRLRGERGVSQEGLADLTGVTRRAVEGWEAGGGIAPRNLRELALALNTTPLYILNGTMGERATPAESEIAELIDKLTELVASGYAERRQGGGMRGNYKEIAELVATIRGDESSTISSLREDVQALRTQVTELMGELAQAVRELRREQRAQGRPDTGGSQREAPGGP